MAKQSVCVPPNSDNGVLDFSSPLFVYAEKLKTDTVISCKQLSAITPLQLLLFGGSRKVEAIGPNLVRLDDVIHLEMDVGFAAEIVALRPALEAIIVKACMDPRQLAQPTQEKMELCELVRMLSSATDWLPEKDDAVGTNIAMSL